MKSTLFAAVSALTILCSAASADHVHCEHQRLNAPDAAAGDNFGYAVAVNGDWLAAGAIHNTVNIVNEGAVYLYQRGNDNVWAFANKVFAADNFPADQFGAAVDLDGDTLIVGSSFDDDNCPAMGNCNSGSAYIFSRNQGGADNWGFVAKLHSSVPASNAFFGHAVAVSRDWAIVGDSGTTDGGGACLFSRNTGGADNWGFVQRIQSTDVSTVDQQGWSVDINGDRCIISAHAKTVATHASAGAAYVFSRSGNSWTQEDSITAPDGDDFDGFSYDVAIHGDRAVVGAPFDDENGSGSGSMYVFQRNGTSWNYLMKQTGTGTDNDDQYGLAVAVEPGYAVCGAYFTGNGQGTGFVHGQNEGGADNWGQLFAQSAFDTTGGIYFAWSVAMDGNWVAIGAYRESSVAVTAGALYLVHIADNDCNANDVCDDYEIVLDPMLDQNSNGTIDACECPADITDNGATNMPDGQVNVFDLLLLLTNWNSAGTGAAIAPPTNVVDVFDLLALLSQWGTC